MRDQNEPQIDRLKAALAERYEIERELGSGGMATVYLARDLKHQRHVAIKVLRPELAAMLGPERFLREIEIAAKLNHPHIIALIDSHAQDGLFFYVMPHVEGESLRDRLNHEKQLTIEETLDIARHVASALDYAHGQGVIHRDIKPENILLHQGEAMVTDFGIALAVHAVGSERLTETGLSLGTPAYMCPEQAAADRDVDGRADVYALGAVVYEMLTGEVPFSGTTAQAVIAKLLTEAPTRLRTLRETVPRSVEAAVMKALAKAPADRFPTAMNFAIALRSGVVEEHAMSAWHTHVRRIAIAVVVAMAITGGVWLWRQSPSLGDPGDTVGPPRLAVLPFVNLGSSQDADFAAGITEEVRTQLSGLSGLIVIARQSAALYGSTDESPQEIGEELGVGYLLDGTITWQRLGDGPASIRVRPRLISTSDAAQVWAEGIDAEVSEVIEVQSRIAQRVAEALHVNLLERERQSLLSRPTSDEIAYELLLRGREYSNRGWSTSNFSAAVDMFGQAVARDSGFALAHAWLSMAHLDAYWIGAEDRHHLDEAKESAEVALTIDPDLPEGHRALGRYYYACCADYTRALAEQELARRARPGDVDLLSEIAHTLRRQGKWEEGLATFREAAELNPKHSASFFDIAFSHVWLGDYDVAEDYLTQAQILEPQNLAIYTLRAWISLLGDGDIERARSWMDQAAERASGYATLRLPFYLQLLRRDFDAALMRIPPERRRLSHSFDEFRIGDLTRIAIAHHLSGRADLATTYFDSARVALEVTQSSQANLVRDSLDMLSGLALVHAGLGNTDLAVAYADAVMEADPIALDAMLGPVWLYQTATALALAGETDMAIAYADSLLSVPSRASINLLQLDPLWDRVRDDQRFATLMRTSAQ